VSHDGSRVSSIALESGEVRATDRVVSTLPTGLLMRMLDPAPPAQILECANKLRHRSLLLVVVTLDRERVSNAATLYVPDPSTPLTRVYEPKNRWSGMAPPGKTSLVAEIPCQRDDSLWNAQDQDLIRDVSTRFVDFGWVRPSEIQDGTVVRLRDAYPVLELGFQQLLDPVMRWLDGLQNLSLSGRGGLFQYSHVHNQLRVGKDIVRRLSEERRVAT
jgi:protoporphyrinogen oxidase